MRARPYKSMELCENVNRPSIPHVALWLFGCSLPTMIYIVMLLVYIFSEYELMFMFAICCHPSICLSVVCNVRAPYSGD